MSYISHDPHNSYPAGQVNRQRFSWASHSLALQIIPKGRDEHREGDAPSEPKRHPPAPPFA